MRKLAALLLLASLAAAQDTEQPAHYYPDPSGAHSYEQQMSHWRKQRLAEVKRDWLPLAGLFWLGEGTNSFGSDPRNAVVLPRGAKRAGAFERRGKYVTAWVNSGVRATVAGKRVHDVNMQPQPPGPATVLALGPLRMHLIARGERLGVRVKDLASPALAKFKGLEYFPLARELRIEADWEPTEGKTLPILNVIGDVTETPTPGVARFTVNGRRVALHAVVEEGRLFFIFGDATNGKTTYPAGRYLYAGMPRDGKVVLDFNQAYNPPCAFTPFATCPLPPRENRLEVAIEAGEKYTGEAGKPPAESAR